MIALLVSPDYASHYFPLSAVGRELSRRGVDVVVATGPALRERVRADGFEHRTLVLGPGSNGGLSRLNQQTPEEADQLARFVEATRRGPIAALRHQAEHRLRDLLWEPDAVAERLGSILDDVRPDMIVSDQLAYGASLALRALEQPFATLLPGHPTALPGPGEVFGVPPYFPPGIRVDTDQLQSLRDLCRGIERRFAGEFRDALRRLNPRVVAPANPFAAGGRPLTLVNYPARLASSILGERAIAVGACVRDESLGHTIEAEIAALPRPRVYVSLGSFLSARNDVLARIAAGIQDEGLSLVLAAGVADPATLGRIGDRALVRPYLPQVAVLPHCDLVVCHGGNGTVTESLRAGVPVLAGPLSTDQFAGAEDVRRAGVGDAFDPNGASPAEIARRAHRLLAGPACRRAAALGRALRAQPGPVLAADLILGRSEERLTA